MKALVFDMDGTIADTEAVHLAAFNHAFELEGMGWHWSEAQYIDLLQISGGKERMAHYWASRSDAPKDIDGHGIQGTIARLHEVKTAAYEALVNDGAVAMRPGVLRLMDEARRAKLALAIATTTSPVNIAAVLSRALGAEWRANFAVIEDASSAPRKKPHPQVYLQTLHRLGLAGADCLAFEDSANGLRAASGAKLPVIITPNRFTQHHDFRGAARLVPDLTQLRLGDLLLCWRETVALACA